MYINFSQINQKVGYCCSHICIIKFTNKEFRIPTNKIPDLLYNQRSGEDYFQI